MAVTIRKHYLFQLYPAHEYSDILDRFFGIIQRNANPRLSLRLSAESAILRHRARLAVLRSTGF
jgi:hypothetical protein